MRRRARARAAGEKPDHFVYVWKSISRKWLRTIWLQVRGGRIRDADIMRVRAADAVVADFSQGTHTHVLGTAHTQARTHSPRVVWGLQSEYRENRPQKRQQVDSRWKV